MKVEIDAEYLETASEFVERALSAGKVLKCSAFPKTGDAMLEGEDKAREAMVQIALAIHRAKENS